MAMSDENAGVLSVEVPADNGKLHRQIEALRYFLTQDADELSRSIHQAALNRLEAVQKERKRPKDYVATVADRETGATFDLFLHFNETDVTDVGVSKRHEKISLPNRPVEYGFRLEDGCVLPSSDKDAAGNFIGWLMGTPPLKSSRRFAPILDENGTIRAFRDVTKECTLFARQQDGKRLELFVGPKNRCEQLLRDKGNLQDALARRMSKQPGYGYLKDPHDWEWQEPQRSVVPADEVGIKSVGVPVGFSKRKTEPGYVLKNGIALLESEKDANGNYYGGTGMDGMYLHAPAPNHLYSPVRNPDGTIRAFRRVKSDTREKQSSVEGGKTMKSAAKNVELEPLDDIFKPRETVGAEQVINVPLSELHPFKEHAFKVRDDEQMAETVESIKKVGVQMPAIIRPRPEGGYEIVAGHRRKHACELLGIETLPALVRDLDDDTATIIMVDTNLQQRDKILPSERAFAYKLKLDAMKRQGQRADLTSVPVAQKSGKTSRELLGEQVGQSQDQVRRYIRLTELIPPLLDLVDADKVKFRPAVELSYLKKEEQALLVTTIESEQSTPSVSQAQRLKEFSQKGKLNEDSMLAIMTEENKEVEKITFPRERIKKYFPDSYTPKQIEDTIVKALEFYQRRRQHEQER